MNRGTGMTVVGIALALSSGCADLMSASAVAPEWFQAKAIEVKGEGYPSLRDIPATRAVSGDRAQWESEGTALKDQAAVVELQAEFEPVSEEDIRARAAQLRAMTERGAPPPTGDRP